MSKSPTPTTSYPLTTVFPPPTSCFTEYWFPTVYPSGTPTVLFVNGPPIGVSTAKKECWPEDHSAVADRESTWYSPGICPSGYATAAASYVSRTMYAYCCMEGYTLLPQQGPPNFVGTTVHSSDFTRDSNSDAICKSELQTAIAIEYESVGGQIYTTDLRKGHSVIEFPIRVKYQMSDFSNFPVDAQPTVLSDEAFSDLEPYIKSGFVTYAPKTRVQTASRGPTGSAGSGPNETNPPSSEPTGSEGENKTGTIAIAVGVTVSVVIVLAIGGFFLFSWRRKKRKGADGLFAKGPGPYKKHNNESQIGGIQEYPDETGGIASAAPGKY